MIRSWGLLAIPGGGLDFGPSAAVGGGRYNRGGGPDFGSSQVQESLKGVLYKGEILCGLSGDLDFGLRIRNRAHAIRGGGPDFGSRIHISRDFAIRGGVWIIIHSLDLDGFP